VTGKPEEQGQNLTTAEAAEYKADYRKGSGLVNKHMGLHDLEPVHSSTKDAEFREGTRQQPKTLAELEG
jgi:hypothetical protein